MHLWPYQHLIASNATDNNKIITIISVVIAIIMVVVIVVVIVIIILDKFKQERMMNNLLQVYVNYRITKTDCYLVY